MYVSSLVTRLQQAWGNPALQGEVNQQPQTHELTSMLHQERGLMEPRNEVPTRRHSQKVEEGSQERERS